MCDFIAHIFVIVSEMFAHYSILTGNNERGHRPLVSKILAEMLGGCGRFGNLSFLGTFFRDRVGFSNGEDVRQSYPVFRKSWER